MTWKEDNPLYCLLNQEYVGRQHVEPTTPLRGPVAGPIKLPQDFFIIKPNQFPNRIIQQALSEERFHEYEAFYKYGGYKDDNGTRRIFDFYPWEKDLIRIKSAEDAAAEDAAAESAKAAQEAEKAGLEYGAYSTEPDYAPFSAATRQWYGPNYQEPGGQYWQPRPRFAHDSTQTDELMVTGQEPMLYLLPEPHPTALYLKRAMSQPEKLDKPKQLLVVLDLNGTLLARTNNKARFIRRPGLDQFLEYLFANHAVAIWSSARPQNVIDMINALLGDRRDWKMQLAAIRDRGDLNLGKHYDSRVQVYKQLSWLWADPEVQQSFPRDNPGEGWDQSNTVLIDDSFLKAMSEPNNLIKIEEYTLDNARAGQPDDTLLAVANYLEGLKTISDVSATMRKLPFVNTPKGTTWSCTWEDVGVKGRTNRKARTTDKSQ